MWKKRWNILLGWYHPYLALLHSWWYNKANFEDNFMSVLLDTAVIQIVKHEE